jgi:RND family efflux transporter MFP subunit
MSRSAKNIVMLVLLTLAVPVLLPAGCTGGKKDKDKDQAPSRVVVSPVREMDFSRRIELVGQLRAADEVDIAPRTGGQIISIAVQIGDRVQQGDLLVQLDDDTLARQVDEARAARVMAQANLVQAQAAGRVAASDLARSEPLAERGMISDQQIELLRANTERAEAAVAVAEAGVNQARARLATLNKQKSDMALRAPFSGAVGARMFDPGSVVAPNQPILKLVGADSLRVTLKIPENEIAAVLADRDGVRVEIRADALPGTVIEARLDRIAAMVNPVARSVTAEAVIDNMQAGLLPGMFVRVNLLLPQRRSLVIISRALLSDPTPTDPGKRFPANGELYVVINDLAIERKVVVGDMQLGLAAIDGGLAIGDLVIVNGASALNDRAKVRYLESETVYPDSLTATVGRR